MKATTNKRIPEHLIEQARAVDIVSLAEEHTRLRQEAGGREWAGPCPKCGGDDRFHVHQEGWFFCRQCHGKRGNVIELVRWRHGYIFPQAFPQVIERLTSSNLPTAKPHAVRPPARQTGEIPPEEWQRKKGLILKQAQALIWEPEGKLAQEYLQGRGLEPHTWQQYGLGYRPDAPLPGTKGRHRAPAIVIPWFARNKLTAIRDRFLELQIYMDSEGKEHREKQTASSPVISSEDKH